MISYFVNRIRSMWKWTSNILLRKGTPMPIDYDFIPETEVIVYEIMLPKVHEAKLKEVLDGFLDKDELRKSPPVKKLLNGIDDNPDWVEKELNEFMEVVKGYSIYQVKGRFKDANGVVVNEDTLIVRIIVPNPDRTKIDKPGIHKFSWNVISFFVTVRFAEELGVEDEVWFTEYTGVKLNRWVKK